MYRLKSGTDFFLSNENELIIYPVIGENAYRVKGYGALYIVMNRLLQGVSCLKDLDGQGGYEHNQIVEAVSCLKSLGLLIEEDRDEVSAPFEYERFQRQMAYFEQSNAYERSPCELQSALSEKSVAVIGCGGVGAPMAEMMVASGISNVLLVDDDVIELSNLARQMSYSESEIGCKKVNCLKDRLLRINGKTRIELVDQRASQETMRNIVKGKNLVVAAADEPLPEIMNWIDEAAARENCAYICISNTPPAIRVGPIFCPHNGVGYDSYRASLRKKWKEIDLYEQIANKMQNNKASTVWSCYAAASFASAQSIQFLLSGESKLLNTSYIVDMESMTIKIGVSL